MRRWISINRLHKFTDSNSKAITWYSNNANGHMKWEKMIWFQLSTTSPLLLRYIISSWKFWWLLVGYDMELLGQQKRKFPKVWFKDTYRAPADVELNFTAFPNCPIFPLNNDIELRMGEEWLWHDKVGIVPFFAHNLRPLQPVLRSCLHYCYKLLNKIISCYNLFFYQNKHRFAR